jgi:hypothetical protein
VTPDTRVRYGARRGTVVAVDGAKSTVAWDGKFMSQSVVLTSDLDVLGVTVAKYSHSCQYDTCYGPAFRAIQRVLRESSRRARVEFGFAPLELCGVPFVGVYHQATTRRAERRADGEMERLVSRLRRALRSTGSCKVKSVRTVGPTNVWGTSWRGREV